ncbi:probable nucleoredoxin 1-1 [Chenopodium quinoa]|uniref:probable nucleoredoxin 1-1 n=1 Tax=Chenopodium quinoa TaxID=63459 RepID=UPI000B78C6FB|nr:probable nucleoredoxin 1-1 [Chenopodium quinoa]
MICCFYVPIFRDSSDAMTVQHIVNTCFDLYNTRNDFEMVVVVKMRYKADYEAVFDHFLSVFPSCLVVPYKESMHRDFICKYLDLVAKSSIKCLILDADDNRNILYHGTPAFLYSYGADAFPFTKEKIKEVVYKDKISHWSLEGLLECDSSYVLENGNEETITISELNKKVVALNLCIDGMFTSTLHMVHQQCIENQLSFEIVLVYMPYDNCLDPRVHKGKIDRLLKKKRISWWCLPINNNVSLKFKRLVGCRDDFKLVIVGPDNEYVDLHGEEILKRRGIDGYPFTREGLIEKELKRLHGLTLESSLVIGSKNYVYKGSTTYPLADLLGKNVLGYFAERSKDLYHPLLTWYPEIKADVDDLEVVFVRLEDELAAAYDDLKLAESVKPWYVCPYDPEHSKILREKIFIVGHNRVRETLVKFGSDGKICSFRAQYHLTYDGPKAFREIGDPHLRQDVIREYLEGML